MNPFLMTIAWTVLAVWLRASGGSDIKIIASLAFATIWGATHMIISEIRKGRS